MKIAVFHNYLDNIGGAEIVGLTMARELGADIYTTNICEEKIKKMGFADVLPRIFSIGSVPINAPLKQQFALFKFKNLNLNNKYEFYIIDGDWAMSGAVHNKPNMWYVHSPIREIWDSYKFTRENVVPPYLRPLFDVWVYYNRYLNKKYADSVDIFACNSENTKMRLKKFLDKDAIVINPPVDTSAFHFEKFGDYWLSVNRIFHNKRIDMQMKAFSKMPNEKLIIVGSYEQSKHFLEYVKNVKKIQPKNVEVKSWVSKEELISLYSRCRGFITTSKDEDFGMAPVEAMASGKPVIAPNEGGYKETIINGKTGQLINDIDESKIINAIKSLKNQIQKNPLKLQMACLTRAKDFDGKLFIDRIKNQIDIYTNSLQDSSNRPEN